MSFLTRKETMLDPTKREARDGARTTKKVSSNSEALIKIENSTYFGGANTRSALTKLEKLGNIIMLVNIEIKLYTVNRTRKQRNTQTKMELSNRLSCFRFNLCTVLQTKESSANKERIQGIMKMTIINNFAKNMKQILPTMFFSCSECM